MDLAASLKISVDVRKPSSWVTLYLVMMLAANTKYSINRLFTPARNAALATQISRKIPPLQPLGLIRPGRMSEPTIWGCEPASKLPGPPPSQREIH
jgi:hypothetical protein